MSKFLIALAATLSVLSLLLALKLATFKKVETIYAQTASDSACIGEGVAKYMNTVIDGAGSLSKVKLLSPAFNMTSPYFNGIVDAMKGAGANFNGLDGIAGNAYNFGGRRITDYAQSAMQSLPDLPLLLTEAGKIDFGVEELKEELSHVKSGNYNGVTYTGALLFNAFNTNPNWSTFALTDSQITNICGGNCGSIGVNYATSWGDLNSANFSRAGSYGMQFALAIATNDASGVANRINSMPSSVTPVIRIGVGNDSGGFENPETYVSFLSEINSKVNRVVYAIAGPNEPESETWATPDCKKPDSDQKSATCSQVKDEEFHTLRPYPADPCDLAIHETTYMCSNQFVAKETFRLGPNGNCNTRADGARVCTYNITGSINTSIKLDDAFLPIVGNTENVPNSKQKTGTLDDTQRVNNYVSWYLNGVLNPQEETRTAVDLLSKEFTTKLVDLSGPINKLMPWDLQARQKIKQVDDANASLSGAGIRHNQIVGCVVGTLVQTALPANCLEILGRGDAFKQRLTEWLSHKPPLMDGVGKIEDYIKAYNEWQGSGCITISFLGFRHDFCSNARRVDFWNLLFANVPYSSTEDRKGTVETRQPPGSIINNEGNDKEVRVTDITYTPADGGAKDILYFPHVQEVAELSEFLQKTFVPKGKTGNENTVFESESPTIAPGCSILETRTNPGDDLYGEDTKDPDGPIRGTLTYKATFDCVFPPPDRSCITRCVEEGGTVDNCSETCNNNVCDKDVIVGIPIETQTPKVEEIWNRLVEGDFAVFKRIFPKIGANSPLEKLKDIPAITRGSYSATGGNGGDVTALAGDAGLNREGKDAEIYIPHVGALKEYFLNGIQNALRPKGFAEEPLSGVLPPAKNIVGDDQGVLGNGTCSTAPQESYCGVQNLLSYFGGDQTKATKASSICNRESGSNIFALNDSCLDGITYDYSVGLFQINLLAHKVADPSTGEVLDCPGAFSVKNPNTKKCVVGNQAVIDRCVSILQTADGNIRKAVEVSSGGTNWNPWSAARACGIQ